MDHLDRNPLNNRPSNLRWVTPAENMQNRTLKRAIPVTLVKEGGERREFPNVKEAAKFLKKKTVANGQVVNGWTVERGEKTGEGKWTCPSCLNPDNDYSLKLKVVLDGTWP